jgi:hypothetical protein
MTMARAFPDAAACVEAMVASDQMDARAAYLGRGRLHELLPDDELQLQWALAFRSWSDEALDRRITAARSNAFDDLTAELGLRNLEPDMAPVPDVVPKLVQHFRRELASRAREAARAAIGDFLEGWLEAAN